MTALPLPAEIERLKAELVAAKAKCDRMEDERNRAVQQHEGAATKLWEAETDLKHDIERATATNAALATELEAERRAHLSTREVRHYERERYEAQLKALTDPLLQAKMLQPPPPIIFDKELLQRAESAESQVAKLREALVASDMDAKRYRWLRDEQEWYECYLTSTMQTKFDAKYPTLDAAIDAAIRAANAEAIKVVEKDSAPTP